MTDLLERLKKRIYPHISTMAVAGAAGGIGGAFYGQANPATVQSGTFTIGGPDKDVQEAVEEIERLEQRLSDGNAVRERYRAALQTILDGSYADEMCADEVADAALHPEAPK